MNEAESILARLLANADAVWLPTRDFLGDRYSAVCLARRGYKTAGLPWHSAGVDDAARREARQVVEDLTREGLAKAFRPRAMKTLQIRLTDQGDGKARQVVGLPNLDAAFAAAGEIAKRSKWPAKLLTEAWIPEHELVGTIPGRDAFAQKAMALEDALLPALTRAYVISNANADRHVSYALTSAGREWLNGDPPAAVPCKAVRGARETYYTELKTASARLEASLPTGGDRDIGEIPLPVSTAGRLMSEIYDPDSYLL
jgi:hypothetical protein